MRLASYFSSARTAASGCECCGTDDLDCEPPPVAIQARGRTPSLSVLPCAAAEVRGSEDSATRHLNIDLPDIQFSAAHFVAYQGFREQLHGHNYNVRVRLGVSRSHIGSDGYIVDFGDVKKVARSLCKPLKSRTLIPTKSDVLQIQETDGQVNILCEDGARMSLPAADCAMLPIVHSTAEEISEYLWKECMRLLGPMFRSRGVEWCEVTVSERPGQGASYHNDVPTTTHVTDTAVPVTVSQSPGQDLRQVRRSRQVARAGAVAPAALDGAQSIASAADSVETLQVGSDDQMFQQVDVAFQQLIHARGPRIAAEGAFRGLLSAALGSQEAARPELVKTPARAAKAFFEQTSGLAMANPLEAVGEGIFDLAETRGVGDVVSVRDVQFHSLCEHHLLPFSGRAHFAYIPDGRVLGLSKFARLTDVIARRPQVQERLTRQLGEGLVTLLQPRAVAVTLEARHCCMSIRGVVQPSAETRTLVILGPDKDDPATRQQLLAMFAPASRL